MLVRVIIKYSVLSVLMVLGFQAEAFANEVKILKADFRPDGERSWTVNVTLKHADTGWDHYADNWQIVDAGGKLLAERVLVHPHVKEQPFTRGLRGVKIPNALDQVYIRAHDKVHGWSQQQFKIDLKILRSH